MSAPKLPSKLAQRRDVIEKEVFFNLETLSLSMFLVSQSKILEKVP